MRRKKQITRPEPTPQEHAIALAQLAWFAGYCTVPDLQEKWQEGYQLRLNRLLASVGLK